MITLRVLFMVIATTLAFGAGALTALIEPVLAHPRPGSSPAVTAPRPTGATATGHASSLGLEPDTLEELLREAEPHVDIYGNEIEDAVTDYRIDSAGDVYERHSPETEVQRLGPPLI